MALIDDLNAAVSAITERLVADDATITSLRAEVASAVDPSQVQAAIAALNAAVAVPAP